MQNVAKGLALATMAATTNSAMELSGKKALSGRGFLESTLFIRLVVACAFTLAAACVFLLRPGWGDLFGSESPRALADPSFLLYAVVATGLVTSAILLYYRAIQTSPLSLTTPLFGFTPVFLLFTNALATGRLPSPATAEGVLIVVLGSILLKWPERSEGWRATVSAVFRDPGSRYMLLASLLLA